MMEKLELYCRLEECEIDGSQMMSLEKCLSRKGAFSPCPNLATKKIIETKRGEVWKKFEQMIDGSLKKGKPRGM